MKKVNADTSRSDQDKRTIALIELIADQVREAVDAGRLPNIKMPVRSLDNVSYDQAVGYLVPVRRKGSAH